jgi:hypothetical protein
MTTRPCWGIPTQIEGSLGILCKTERRIRDFQQSLNRSVWDFQSSENQEGEVLMKNPRPEIRSSVGGSDFPINVNIFHDNLNHVNWKALFFQDIVNPYNKARHAKRLLCKSSDIREVSGRGDWT